MSSSMCLRTRSRSGLAFGFLGAVLVMGCGRSPAMPRTPVQMVRVEHAPAVVVVASEGEDEDEDADGEEERLRKPVEYVHLSEWQAPASAQRAEAAVPPRGDQPSELMKFPELTLHRPIATTTFARARRGFRR